MISKLRKTIRNRAVSSWGMAKGLPWLAEFAVFAAMLIVYLPLQASQSFADPDAFYHLKIAELTAAHGPVRSFPWLPFTTLASSFADHHFLYHVALIPFIKIFGALHGIKLATAIFAAAAVASVAWALRRLDVRYPALWAVLAGVMNPFVFRIGLAKASALGVLLLVVGLTFAIERKAWPLAIVSFIYVWTHGGWPALLVLGTVAVIVMSWGERRSNGVIASDAVPVGQAAKQSFSGLLRRLTPPRNDGFKSIAALWGGALAGLVFNPFFPQNLKFYWEQIVQIAVINYQDVIGVGNEWYPYAFRSLWDDLPLLFVLSAAAILILPVVLEGKKDDERQRRFRIALALSACAMLFLFMTLRSRRHVEYFVPLMMLSVASWSSQLPWGKIRPFARRYAISFFLLGACLVSMTAVYAQRSLAQAKKDLDGSYRFTLYEKASAFLAANTEPNEVIIHSDWDQMPPLFWWNDKDRYMMGLDPTFLYNASHERYKDYVDFTLGKSADPIKVMDEFGARFVLSDRGHANMQEMLEKSGRFEKAYTDSETFIYRLKR